jgi:methyl-accepting chemotaxis protein
MFKSLQARILTFVIVLLVGTVFAIGLLSYQQLRSQVLDGIEQDAKSATTGYAFAVSEWLAIRSSMVASLRPVVGKPEAADVYARYAEAGGFDLVYAGSPDKRMVFSKPQTVPAGYDPTQRPWYQGAEAVGPNGVFVSKPYVDAFTGALIMSLATVVQENGKTKGVVANDMSIAQVVKEVLSVRLPGEGYAFVVHKDGTVLVHPNKDAVLKPVTALVPELTPERIAQAVAGGRMFTAKRADGDRFMVLVPVKNSDWVLGATLSREIVLQPLDRLLLTLGALFWW